MTEHGCWDVTSVPASPALRPFVAAYCGYRQVGGAPGIHRGLPSPYLTMIVTIDDPLTIVAPVDAAEPGGDYLTLVGGLHDRPTLIGHPGRQAGIQVALHPLGARALFGLPAGELAQRSTGLEQVLGGYAGELYERVQEATSWPSRFAALDAVLSRTLRHDRPVRPEAAWAWQRIVASGGGVRVAALAAEVGLSPRHLDATLRRETGLTPKTAARVVRFDRARRLLAAGASGAAVAARCGYFDQAHLTRDFRDFAGCAPTRWLAEEFRFVQAHPRPDGAGWAV